MNRIKAPLYRKVNKTTISITSHDIIKNPDVKYDRGKKGGIKRSMSRKHTGYDYTPLFKFLLSKIGKDWDEIYSEAVKRLDSEEPIFYIVAKTENDKRDYICCGQSSYYSGLFIDDDNTLQLVNPEFKNENLHPICTCCTHTFNGKVFTNKTPEILKNGN